MAKTNKKIYSLLDQRVTVNLISNEVNGQVGKRVHVYETFVNDKYYDSIGTLSEHNDEEKSKVHMVKVVFEEIKQCIIDYNKGKKVRHIHLLPLLKEINDDN